MARRTNRFDELENGRRSSGRGFHLVWSEVHIVLQADLGYPCHRFCRRQGRKGLLLIRAGYRVEECLVQLRGNAEHAAQLRRPVVESMQRVWRQYHGRAGFAMNPIFFPIQDAKEIWMSLKNVEDLGR